MARMELAKGLDLRPLPKLIGIVHLWIRNVRIIGYRHNANKYIPVGSVGDLEVLEVSVDGEVLKACFHSGGGYGLVIWPNWEHVDAQDPAWTDAWRRP